jgi:hypothetical protein
MSSNRLSEKLRTFPGKKKLLFQEEESICFVWRFTKSFVLLQAYNKKRRE